MDDDAVGRGVAHFQVVQARGRFHWELVNPHGTPMGRSMESFETEDEALANAEYARRLISHAPIRGLMSQGQERRGDADPRE
jgi:hypothetical protein